MKQTEKRKTVSLAEEISVGRTNLAQVVLPDTGLSRLNTIFFRDDDTVFVVDENSLNGTFLNGEKVPNEPKRLFDGDEIRIGSSTRIRVEIVESRASEVERPKPKVQSPSEVQSSKFENPQSEKPPLVLIIAVSSAFLIVFLAVIGYLIASLYENNSANSKENPLRKSSLPPQFRSALLTR
ncbi:MAG: FHA domain-containing protein [Pyrinomonadaceae bacterium]